MPRKPKCAVSLLVAQPTMRGAPPNKLIEPGSGELQNQQNCGLLPARLLAELQSVDTRMQAVRAEAARLTADGQYPNSSRNSSGFSTADSDRILSAFRWSVRLRRGHRSSRPPRRLPTRCLTPLLHGEDGEASIRTSPSPGVPCGERRHVVTAQEGKEEGRKVCWHARGSLARRGALLWMWHQHPPPLQQLRASRRDAREGDRARQLCGDKSCSCLNPGEEGRRVGRAAAARCTRQLRERERAGWFSPQGSVFHLTDSLKLWGTVHILLL